MNKKIVSVLVAIPLFGLCGCSNEEDAQGLGEPYVVDLTALPTEGEGMLTLKPDAEDGELSGTFQVGPYSVDIRVEKTVVNAADIDIGEPFEGRAKVIIPREDEASTGFHRIYQISEIEVLD